MSLHLPSETSHAEALAAEAKRVADEAARLSATLKDQEKIQRKKLSEVQARLAKLREEQTKLRAEHDRVLTDAETEARQSLMENNISEADLKASRCTADEYLDRHLEPAEIDRKAKEAAEARVAPIFKALRSVALDVLRLEVEEAEAAAEVEYCRTSPIQAHVESLKAMLKSKEAAAGLVFGAFCAAITTRDNLRHRLEIASGCSGRGGLPLYNLGLAELEDLRFSPLITDASLPELESLIAQVRAAGLGAKVATLGIDYDGKFSVVRVDGAPRVKK